MTDVLLRELRVRFRQTAGDRLEEMASALEALERDPHDAAAINILSRHFHAFAGLGATYGFPRVSTLADEAEAELVPIARHGGEVTRELVARWSTLATEIEAALEEAGEPAPLPNVSPAEAGEFDVLLVEDDPELAPLLQRALEDEGVCVRTCATREAALAEIDFAVPDALVTDIRLGDGSGYDVLEALRRSEGGEAAGAVVISIAHEFIDKVRAIRSGADAFVGKPLDIQSLVRRVLGFRARKQRPAARVLAVEDDPTQGLILHRVLGAAGYEVAVCSDPAEFERTLDAFAPDVLLMDIHLNGEGVSGYDLVRYVRQNERFAAIPVIFVTGDQERRAQIDSALSGGDVLVSKPVDWQLLLSQIAARLQRATALRDLTDRDPLTGLLTRRAFEARTRERLTAPATLLLIDLDRFKEVNDTYGHAAGDAVLAALGLLLRRRLRQTDDASRYGGEEFAVLLDAVSPEDARRLAERLLEEFSAIEHGPAFRVTFSAGVAPLEGSIEASFRRADAALYEAKRSGRAKVVAV